MGYGVKDWFSFVWDGIQVAWSIPAVARGGGIPRADRQTGRLY